MLSESAFSDDLQHGLSQPQLRKLMDYGMILWEVETVLTLPHRYAVELDYEQKNRTRIIRLAAKKC